METKQPLPAAVANYVAAAQPQTILNQLIRQIKSRIKELETQLAEVTSVLSSETGDPTLETDEYVTLIIVANGCKHGIYELKALLKTL